jgi:glycosyltransferase involved in cell wall biosynthesis
MNLQGASINSKKNLVFFYPSLEIGGLTKNLFSLINSLSQKKYSIIFITFNTINKNKVGSKLYAFDNKIKVITPKIKIRTNNRYLKYFFCFFLLLKYLYQNNNLLISFQSNVLAILAAKITNSKIIIRCNTAPSKYISNFIKKIFFKIIYSKSDKILVTSRDFKLEMKKYFNLNSLVHRQSLDIVGIKRKSKKKINFKFFKGYKNLKIINVGRLTYQKDIITLLKSFSELIKIRKARLLLVGNGTEENKIKKFVKNNKLTEHVRIIGFQQNPYNYISLADVKVLSSRFEGNPNILLEVACLKKLIISSNCKIGPSEILQKGRGGILYKVGDVKSLFKILKDLDVNNKISKNKINISYKYVKNNFKKDISKPFIEIIKNIK